MRRICIAVALLLVAVTARTQAADHVFRETFAASTDATFAARWETVGGDWRVQGGVLWGASPAGRGFAYLPDVPEVPQMEVSARLRVSGRDSAQGWSVGGVALFRGPTDFWQLALVEGPDGKRYVELVEMLAGDWQAQRSGENALTQTANDGQWAGWERDHDYDLTLALSAQGVAGTVADAAGGARLSTIAYAWGSARGVKSGRPGLLTSGFRLAVKEVRARWTPPGALPAGIPVEFGARGAVAVLADPAARIGSESVAGVVQALREGGYGATLLTCQQLETAGVLDAQRFAALVLADSPRFPAAATETLRRYLREGGDLVLMGGLPFSTPLVQVGDLWLTEEEVELRLAQTPVRHVLFDFEDGQVQAWRRSTNHADRPSRATTVSGPSGRALQLDIHGLEGWDTFGVNLPTGLAPTDNVLCFRAQALATTPAMVVELKEADGSRWLATVPLRADWQPYALPATRFGFWGDASPSGRGRVGDAVRFAEVRYLSFGLAASHIAGIGGDHRLWLDQVGTGHAELPAAVPESDAWFNAFSDYEVYRLAAVQRVVPAENGGIVKTGLSLDLSCQGWSAVGFAFPNESTFIPLLSGEDALGRSQGWVAGALLNHRGAFRNSAWLLFGVETPEFYRQPAFLAELPALLGRICAPELTETLREAERRERVKAYALETPPPHTGFIRRSADGQHLLFPDGRRFFMVGCNYVGGFSRCGGRMWADEFFDAREVEDDFRKAHEAGLNSMRYWLQATLDEDIRGGRVDKVQTIRECARRYGIYLLLDLPGTGYPTEEAMLASHRAIAAAFRDEPMVLGYDLRNEPYVTTLGGIAYTGNKPPVQTVDLSGAFPGVVDRTKVDSWLQERPWWLHLPTWIQGGDAQNVVIANALWARYTQEFGLDASSVPGLDGAVPVGAWQPVIDVVDQSLARWLDGQLRAIREVDPNHLITVGHNTALGILPANARLDFVSRHVYTRPLSYEKVMENLTTLERLRRLWPDRPISFGEFGYSNGIALGESYLDPDTASVGEMLHFLYAFANGYDGCKKWMLVDWPLAMMCHYGDWNRGLATRLYEERFGLYSYDGTRQGRPKPIVPALRFFRGLLDRMDPGGTLTVTRDANPIGTGYVFHGARALFVGGRRADLPELRYRADQTTNVMLEWDTDSLRIMSTASAIVELDPELLPKAHRARVGTAATLRQGRWPLALPAGSVVVLK